MLCEIRGEARLLPYNGEMKEYGLIGHPLGHSFSRAFFTEKFEKEHIEALYLNFDIPDVAMLQNIVLEHPDLVGLNCTIPYKESVIPLLDEVSPEALEIGAVNVIKIQRNDDSPEGVVGNGVRLQGYNTDIIGFSQSISPLLQEWHRHALVLGTGGAAKAVCLGLSRLGVECTSVSRKSGDGCLAYQDLTPETIRDFKVVVNCTPVGMFPHVDEAPSIPYEALTPDHVLYDLVYNPEETVFLRRGREAGAVVKNGMDMLRLQALAGWDIWTK